MYQIYEYIWIVFRGLADSQGQVGVEAASVFTPSAKTFYSHAAFISFFSDTDSVFE